MRSLAEESRTSPTPDTAIHNKGRADKSQEEQQTKILGKWK
jgi:hypothetical protein